MAGTTTVADADVAVHMDANPFVRELQTKLRPIMKRVGKDTFLKVGVDEAGMERAISSTARKVSRRTKVNVPVEVSGDSDRRVSGFFGRIQRGFLLATDQAASFAKFVGSGVGSAFSVVQSAAGPAITAIAILIGVKLVGVLITATALVAGLGAMFASALAIAGGAFLIFGAAALPILSKIIKAVQGGDKEINKLPKGLQGAAREVQKTKKAFDTWLVPLQEPIGRVVSSFARLTTAVLPKFTPIVMGMASAVENLGNRAAKALDGPTFNAFFSMLEQRGPRIFTNLANAAGNFGAGLVNVLTTVGPFAESLAQKIEKISNKFLQWSQSAQGQKDIREFFQWVKDNAPGFADGLKDAGKALLKLGKDLSSGNIAEDLGDAADAINSVAKAIEALNKALNLPEESIDAWKKWLHDATGQKDEGEFKVPKGKKPPETNAFSFGGGGIDTSAITNAATTAAQVVRNTIGGAFTTAKNLAVSGVSSIASTLMSLPGRAMAALSTLGGAIGFPVSSAMGFLRGVISSGISSAASTIGSLVGRAASALSGLPGVLGGIASSAASAIGSGLRGAVGAAASAMGALRGAVLGGLSGLAGAAFGAAARIGHSIASGIRSSIGAVASAGKALAGAVARALPGSPVKEGPLKVLNRGHAGKQISEMLAEGIEAGRSSLGQALTRALKVPALAGVPSKPMQKTTTTTTTTYSTPTFNVTSNSADPMAVANAAFRQARYRGWF